MDSVRSDADHDGVNEDEAPAVFDAVTPPPSTRAGLPRPPDGDAVVYQGGLYTPPPAPAWPPPAATYPPPGASQYVTPPPVYVNVPAPQVRYYAPRDHHFGMHLILTVVTCGLWLPVWLLIEFGGAMWAALRRMFR